MHHHRAVADIEMAQYLAWSRTWEALARQSSLRQRDVQYGLIEFFRTLCRQLEPAVVLEIGAHEATFSRWAADSLPGARVEAFEANPHVYEKYAAELSECRLDYHNLAVGEMTGEVQLNLPTAIAGRERSLTSRMASLAPHTESVDNIHVSVPSVRLGDHVSLAPGTSGVAWIDVEGAEGEVLKGCGSLLDRLHAIFIEVEKRTTWEGQWLDTDVNRFLCARGLVAVARDVFVKNRAHQYNVVFVRAPIAQRRQTARLAAKVLAFPIHQQHVQDRRRRT